MIALGWSKNLLFNWQSLAGSLLGAALPIIVGFVAYLWKSKQDFRRELYGVNVLVTSAITDCDNVKDEIKLLDERLAKMLDAINSAKDGWFVGGTNFPTLKLDYGTRLVEVRTRSLYLANKLLACQLLLKSIDAQLGDLQFEFRRALTNDHDRLISASQLGLDPSTQKNLLIAEIVGIRNALGMVSQNLSVAMRELIRAHTYLQKYFYHPTFTRLRYEGLFLQKLRDDAGSFYVEVSLGAEIEKALSVLEKK